MLILVYQVRMGNEVDKGKRAEYKLLLQILNSSVIPQLSSHRHNWTWVNGIRNIAKGNARMATSVFNVTCRIEKAQQ